jgi:hypothetical protein
MVPARSPEIVGPFLIHALTFAAFKSFLLAEFIRIAFAIYLAIVFFSDCAAPKSS